MRVAAQRAPGVADPHLAEALHGLGPGLRAVSPRWRRAPSVSCAPTRDAGFIDDIGSWKIIARSVP